MSKLTKEQIDKYVKSGGVKCPKCESEQLEGGQFEADAGFVYQPITCNECGFSYNDTYDLVGVDANV